MHSASSTHQAAPRPPLPKHGHVWPRVQSPTILNGVLCRREAPAAASQGPALPHDSKRRRSLVAEASWWSARCMLRLPRRQVRAAHACWTVPPAGRGEGTGGQGGLIVWMGVKEPPCKACWHIAPGQAPVATMIPLWPGVGCVHLSSCSVYLAVCCAASASCFVSVPNQYHVRMGERGSLATESEGLSPDGCRWMHGESYIVREVVRAKGAAAEMSLPTAVTCCGCGL